LTARASRELSEIVARARKEAERLVAELRLQGGSREAVKETCEGLEVLKTPPSLPSFIEEENVREDQLISPGQWVWVKHLSQKGLVLEGSGPQGMVEVQLPIGRVKLPSQALVLVEGDKQSFQPLPFFTGSKEALSPEITLIGFSSEEAVKAAERYLDDAFLGGLRRVRIIHGKGTGALRKAIEEMLKCHPLVESFHLADFNEGGAGATIVELASRTDN
jgi:DNA mismatch repair protein MutS2